MVDPEVGRSLDLGLGTKRHTQTGCAQHGDVIGSVPNSNDLFQVTLLHLRDHGDQVALAARCDHRADGAPRQQPLRVHLQLVRECVIQTKKLLHMPGENRKSAGDHSHLESVPLQGAAEDLCSRGELKIRFNLGKQFLGIGPSQQAHTLPEGLVEINLPGHSRLCDCFDLLLHPSISGQLIDDLLLNQGRIHVEHNHTPRPPVHVVILQGNVCAELLAVAQQRALQAVHVGRRQ
mmetsp:Transcript_26333/g.63428  ORF Transcript_26333/g.63428 Transcript_26333/m.63428 type:complete len:234 (-) Transcript_26333:1841-2542(-)